MKKFIKILLTVSMLFTCFGVNVFADTNVKEICVSWNDVPNEDGEGTHTQIIDISFANSGEEGNGYLISGGKYELTETEADKFILVDGCDVDANIYHAGDYRIINGGSYVTNGNREKYQNFEQAEFGTVSADNLDDLVSAIEYSSNYCIYYPQNGDEIEGEIWADQVNIAQGVTATVKENSSINVFDSLYVDGTLAAEEGSFIRFYPPEDISATVSGNGITLYDSDGVTPIKELSEYAEFRYNGEKWTIPEPTYDDFPWDESNEALVEMCIVGNVSGATSSLTYQGAVNIPNIEKNDGLSHKFVVPKGTQNIELIVYYDDANYHVDSASCEKDEKLEFCDNKFVFDIDDLILQDDTFVNFTVEINENIANTIEYTANYDDNCGHLFIKDNSNLVGIGGENNSFIIDDNKASQTFYILEEEGYRFDNVSINLDESEFHINYLDDEEIETVIYKVVNIEALNSGRSVYSIDFNFVDLINVTFNSPHGSVKLITHDFDLDKDCLTDLDISNPVVMDKTDGIEFAVVVTDQLYTIKSVKLGSTVLNKNERNIDGTSYNCYLFNTNNDKSYIVNIEYSSLLDDFAIDLANYKLAFSGDKDELKGYAAKYIYDQFCHNWHDDDLKYSSLFSSENDLKLKISISDAIDTNGSITYDGSLLPYYTYTIEGVDGFTGRIYSLSTKSEFILRDGNTYKKIVAPPNSSMLETTLYESVERINDYEFFGNGAFDQEQSLLYDGQDTLYGDVRQVGTLISDFNVACKLVLYTNNFRGVYIKSNYSAAPWAFANYPLYALNNGATANIFYANEEVEISTPDNSPSASAIVDINFSNGAKEMNGSKIEENSGVYKVTFGSVFYDAMTLNVTFAGGLTKGLNIKRVGIKLLDNSIKNNQYEVFHGTDHTTKYNGTVDDSTCMISASFYYIDTTNRVSLFARITNADGSITTKEIKTPLNNSIGEANQGTHKSFDDFAVWEGAEKDKPRKVEVIAYVSGSGDTFGGVKLGSGAGVTWTR